MQNGYEWWTHAISVVSNNPNCRVNRTSLDRNCNHWTPYRLDTVFPCVCHSCRIESISSINFISTHPDSHSNIPARIIFITLFWMYEEAIWFWTLSRWLIIAFLFFVFFHGGCFCRCTIHSLRSISEIWQFHCVTISFGRRRRHQTWKSKPNDKKKWSKWHARRSVHFECVCAQTGRNRFSKWKWPNDIDIKSAGETLCRPLNINAIAS